LEREREKGINLRRRRNKRDWTRSEKWGKILKIVNLIKWKENTEKESRLASINILISMVLLIGKRFRLLVLKTLKANTVSTLYLLIKNQYFLKPHKWLLIESTEIQQKIKNKEWDCIVMWMNSAISTARPRHN